MLDGLAIAEVEIEAGLQCILVGAEAVLLDPVILIDFLPRQFLQLVLHSNCISVNYILIPPPYNII